MSDVTRLLTGVLATAAALVSSCGGGTGSTAVDQRAIASGATIKNLAAGHLDALPTGAVYIQVNMFAQVAGAVIGSKKHVPGIVMQEQGVQRLEVEGSPPLDIHTGEADFLPSITHEHLNPGPAANLWYNFAVWPTSARSAPLTAPGTTVAFTTPDLPAGALPQGAYAISLQMITLQPGGRTQAHTYGGVDVIFVLGGSVKSHADRRTSTTLTRGGGSWALAGTGLQEFNAGAQPATFLSFVIVAIGKPFETALNRSV